MCTTPCLTRVLLEMFWHVVVTSLFIGIDWQQVLHSTYYAQTGTK